MKQVLIDRLETCDEGTFGWARVFDEIGTLLYQFATLELPWRGNARGRSCAPAGEYLFRYRKDGKHGPCYEEWDDPATPEREDVKDRDNIQIHPANLAGDVDKGYVSQLEGCIAPGAVVAKFRGGTKPAGEKDQRGVSASKSTFKQLVAVLGEETFRVVIKWADGVEPKEAA